jgi:hypothetical protein
MTHLADRDIGDDAPPARDRGRFPGRQPLALAVLEAEGRIEIRAHQVVLEFRGLVQHVQQHLAAGHGRCGFGLCHLVHAAVRLTF